MSDRPIDLLKCSLMPKVWNKTRYIVSTLKLKNDTGTAKYLLPVTARLEIHGELVACATPSAEYPGSHKGASWGTTYEKGNVVQAGLRLNDKVTRKPFWLFVSFRSPFLYIMSRRCRFVCRARSVWAREVAVGVGSRTYASKSFANGLQALYNMRRNGLCIDMSYM